MLTTPTATVTPVVPAAPAAVPVQRPRLRTMIKVNLKIKCEGIPNFGLPSSDIMVVVLENRNAFGWVEVGRTEVVSGSPNPEFANPIKMEYHFEMAQVVKFDVYNVSTTVEGQNFIGTAYVILSDIFTRKKCHYVEELSFEDVKGGRGRISVLFEEDETTSAAVEFKVKGKDLDKKDLFGKSDPYFTLYKKTHDGFWAKAYRSEVIMKTLNPEWNKFYLRTWDLCGDDMSQEIKVECCDWNKRSANVLIGEGKFTFEKMVYEGSTKSVELIHPFFKKTKKKYKNSGELIFESARKTKIPTFIEFLNSDLEVNFMVAIDFTGSNGNPKFPGSLHHIDGDHDNMYMKAIRSVGSILAAYDKDQKIPAFGFGAKVSGGETDHCFPLNGNDDDPEVDGIEGVMKAYKETLDKVTLFGPTYFKKIIKKATKIAKDKSKKNPYRYFILLILTDGVIDDMSETVDTIVEAANEAPLSIVITGIGNSNFAGMNYLDSDDRFLINSKGVSAHRDIVQFVPFNDYAHCPPMLAQETLAEIPKQVVTYMLMKGYEPVLASVK